MRTDRFVILLFLGALAAPHVDLVFRPGASWKAARAEERLPKSFPALTGTVDSIQSFPPRFDAWFNDWYGLRDKFLHWRNTLLIQVAGVSPTEKLVLGKDGSFFIDDSRSIDVFRGVAPFTEAELRSWSRTLGRRLAWCEDRGIALLHAIAPNKSEVYPELFPDRYDRVGPTRLDQLLSHLRDRPEAEVLDLKPVILKEKERDREGDEVYFPLGSHWTDRGAYAAYVAIVEQLRSRIPDLELVPESSLLWGPGKGPGDSWAARLHMRDEFLQRFREIVELDPERREVSERARQRGLRLVMFHDSFGLPLQGLLRATFSHCTFVANNPMEFDPSLIESERPDVVVVLHVERVLGSRRIPPPPDLLAADELESRFEASNEVLLSVDGGTKRSRLVATGRMVLKPGPDGLEMITSSALDMFRPPPFVPPDRDVPALRIEMTSPGEALLTIFYTIAEGTEFTHGNVYTVRLAPGRHRYYVEMHDPMMSGGILLRPGSGQDRFVLHDLQVRAIPTGTR